MHARFTNSNSHVFRYTKPSFLNAFKARKHHRRHHHTSKGIHLPKLVLSLLLRFALVSTTLIRRTPLELVEGYQSPFTLLVVISWWAKLEVSSFALLPKMGLVTYLHSIQTQPGLIHPLSFLQLQRLCLASFSLAISQFLLHLLQLFQSVMHMLTLSFIWYGLLWM